MGKLKEATSRRATLPVVIGTTIEHKDERSMRHHKACRSTLRKAVVVLEAARHNSIGKHVTRNYKNKSSRRAGQDDLLCPMTNICVHSCISNRIRGVRVLLNLIWFLRSPHCTSFKPKSQYILYVPCHVGL